MIIITAVAITLAAIAFIAAKQNELKKAPIKIKSKYRK